jgi:hypothetical protein
LEMVMRIVRAAEDSRAVAPVTMGGMFTDNAGLTEACIG